MKVYSEVSLESFEFWSGAVATAKILDTTDFSVIEGYLEELYPDGMEDCQINDLFWFDDDTIAEWLGYPSFEELYNERKKEREMEE